jgi:hypothetical protein
MAVSKYLFVMKIVVNSNTSYKLPLKILLESILKSDIKDTQDVIVVISESERETHPTLVDIKSIVDIDSELKVVLVESIRRNYDYCGFDILYKYQSNPLIDSNEYLYLHDTTKVDCDFYGKIQKFENLEDKLIISPATSNSNIVIFQKNVVLNYKENFSVDMNKRQATLLETDNQVYVDGRWIGDIHKFGTVRRIDQRKLIDHVDIYNTGFNRAVFYYEAFGVTKYLFWNCDGDIKKNIDGPTIS